MANQLLADLILVVHALFIAFVVLGFALIVIGMFRHWDWVRNMWFRLRMSSTKGSSLDVTLSPFPLDHLTHRRIVHLGMTSNRRHAIPIVQKRLPNCLVAQGFIALNCFGKHSCQAGPV
ncbi:MAG: DUF2784 family protein, partial [Pseudomonadota bacterium]